MTARRDLELEPWYNHSRYVRILELIGSNQTRRLCCDGGFSGGALTWASTIVEW